MRALLLPALVMAVAAPAAAFAQTGQTALQGQATAVQLTRKQALRDLAHAGYTDVSKLALGPSGTWTAMTPKGAVKVNVAGEINRAP